MWICFSSKRMPLNQSKAFPGEEARKSWLLRAQQELWGSWRFSLIPPAKPVSLQSKWLEGFSVIITFFPGQVLRKAFMSVCSGVMCTGTSDTPATGAPPSPALLTVLPLAILPPWAAFKDSLRSAPCLAQGDTQGCRLFMLVALAKHQHPQVYFLLHNQRIGEFILSLKKNIELF